MSGVDVLAVMDDTRLSIGAAIDSAATDAGVEAWDAHLYKHDEARAAVAELIEAAGTVVEAHTNPSARNRLRAALARCRGGDA